MFRTVSKIVGLGSFRKGSQQQVCQKMQSPQFKSLMNKYIQRFSSQTEEIITQHQPEQVKLQKKPVRIFLAFLALNGLLAYAYMKKVEYDNRYDFQTLVKLLEFKKAYEADKTKYTAEEIKQLFDQFIVENVSIHLNEKLTKEMRKITSELCEKYPQEREVQMFASQVCEYEKYAMYLKATLVIDRKYVDNVLIRQMALNCERYGKDKPHYFDEFYDACTKYSLDSKHEESQFCLNHYLSMNPPHYYRAAIQQIKNYKETNNATSMLRQIDELLHKEKDLDAKEIEHILSFVKSFPQNEMKNSSDKIKAAQLLLNSNSSTELSQKYIKSVLDKEKNNLEALSIQSQIYKKQDKIDLYNSTIKQINTINPTFLSSQSVAATSPSS